MDDLGTGSDKTILIDTAGRYAIPVDEGRDKDEWQKFLTLLALRWLNE